MSIASLCMLNGSPDLEVTKHSLHHKILKKKITHDVIHFANQDTEYSIKSKMNCSCTLWNYVPLSVYSHLYYCVKSIYYYISRIKINVSDHLFLLLASDKEKTYT